MQTMLEDYKGWRMLVQGKPWSTSPIEWSDLFLNGCICWLCESFYIRRCWKMMDQRIWILVPLLSLSMITMVANLYLAIAMGIAFKALSKEGTLTDDTLTTGHFLLPSTIVAFSFWIFGSLVLEVSVTGLLLVGLWRHKTGEEEVDKTILNVMNISWESAILPSFCMVIAVGLYHAKPVLDDHLVLFFVLLTGKFYTFGMLRTLNSRSKLRLEIQGHSFGRTSLTTLTRRDPNSRRKRKYFEGGPKSSTNSTVGSSSEESTTSPSISTSLECENGIRVTSSFRISTPSLEADNRSLCRARVFSDEQREFPLVRG
ncbi:hypothetical protein CPB83DRAFT_214292 [Crepidotus variabilis]|uniref:DUF6534 domain-containing protein n=1 Tax=Crepidotus variabilis TaxID=179855 RepID=A0A9P6EU81_9AGAR|nr:hypothetical protein CPB83DRAFT_214292 [Crepidotus variabilis]